MSPLYECGNNDCLLVVALTKVHPVGYRDWESLKEELKQDVLRDKKYDVLAKKLEGVKSVADAQKQGARVDTVPVITFASPVYLPSTQSNEPALSGAVVATKQGEFCKSPVKGNFGAYVFQVLKRNQREGAKYDEKAQSQTQKQMAMRAAFGAMFQELYQKANVVDNRYLFF